MHTNGVKASLIVSKLARVLICAAARFTEVYSSEHSDPIINSMAAGAERFDDQSPLGRSVALWYHSEFADLSHLVCYFHKGAHHSTCLAFLLQMLSHHVWMILDKCHVPFRRRQGYAAIVNA